jgi:hypothetical protein
MCNDQIRIISTVLNIISMCWETLYSSSYFKIHHELLEVIIIPLGYKAQELIPPNLILVPII